MAGKAGSTASGRTAPPAGRLADLLTDHGAQLRQLRAEQESLRLEVQVLRRCLNSVGCVSCQFFDEEFAKELPLPSAPPDVPVDLRPPSSSVSSRGTTPTRSRPPTGSVTSVRTATGTPTRSAQPTAASTARAASRSSTPTPSSGLARTTGPRSGKPPPNGSVSSRKSSSPAMPRCASEKSITSTATARTLPRTSRGPGDAVAAAASRPRPGAARRTERQRTPRSLPQGAARGAQDLHQILQPLLTRDGAAGEERQRLLAEAKCALDHGASLHAWQGPSTPMRAAVQAPLPDVLQLLLAARGSPDESDDKGVSILHTASFDGQIDQCRLLLDARADANIRDQHGQTPIFFAPVRSVCEVLLQRGAAVDAVNQKGQSALHLAGRAGLSDVLAWLAAHVDREVIEARDIHGATSAYYARHAGVPMETLLRHRLVTPENASTLLERVRRNSVGAEQLLGSTRGSRALPILEEVSETVSELDPEELDQARAPASSSPPLRPAAGASVAAEKDGEEEHVSPEGGCIRAIKSVSSSPSTNAPIEVACSEDDLFTLMFPPLDSKEAAAMAAGAAQGCGATSTAARCGCAAEDGPAEDDPRDSQRPSSREGAPRKRISAVSGGDNGVEQVLREACEPEACEPAAEAASPGPRGKPPQSPAKGASPSGGAAAKASRSPTGSRARSPTRSPEPSRSSSPAHKAPPADFQPPSRRPADALGSVASSRATLEQELPSNTLFETCPAPNGSVTTRASELPSESRSQALDATLNVKSTTTSM